MAKRRAAPCVIMCVGNPYMKDDGIGIEVAKELRRRRLGRGVEVIERQAPDLSVLLHSTEARGVIIVDAVKTGSPPGTVTKTRIGDKGSSQLKLRLAHELGLDDLVELAANGGIAIRPITVIGVEPANCEVGVGLTPVVSKALPSLLAEVLTELDECCGSG